MIPELSLADQFGDRHNVEDWNVTKCRSTLAAPAKDDHDAKLAAFVRILENFHPAMRHVFFERYKTASQWFEMRLQYSRSLSTNSIVGWVLGIGDRHMSNLMFDKLHGDMIMIDFGIAFEAVRFDLFRYSLSLSRDHLGSPATNS